MLHRNSLTKCLPDKTSQKYGLTKCLPDKTSKSGCWRNVILTICLPDKTSADRNFHQPTCSLEPAQNWPNTMVPGPWRDGSGDWWIFVQSLALLVLLQATIASGNSSWSKITELIMDNNNPVFNQTLQIQVNMPNSNKQKVDFLELENDILIGKGG